MIKTMLVIRNDDIRYWLRKTGSGDKIIEPGRLTSTCFHEMNSVICFAKCQHFWEPEHDSVIIYLVHCRNPPKPSKREFVKGGSAKCTALWIYSLANEIETWNQWRNNNGPPECEGHRSYNDYVIFKALSRPWWNTYHFTEYIIHRVSYSHHTLFMGGRG
jgi:hypothetical protein